MKTLKLLTVLLFLPLGIFAQEYKFDTTIVYGTEALSLDITTVPDSIRTYMINEDGDTVWYSSSTIYDSWDYGWEGYYFDPPYMPSFPDFGWCGTITPNEYIIVFTEEGVTDVFLKIAFEYEKECQDTIKGIPYEGDYIIDHDSYREWVSEFQLNERGYYYKYRWVIATDPLEMEYIFIRKPTMIGFLEYLHKKYKQ